MNEDFITKQDSLRSILTSVIIILVAGSGFLLLGKHMDSSILTSLGHVIVISGGLWMFCRVYVQFLWIRYPWDEYTVIHIILEVLGIGVFTNVYGFVLYKTELWLGFNEPTENLGLQIIITLLITYLITGIHEMIYFYQQWIHNFSKSVRLEKDNIEARYETLKTQINPHFLFNSLNSLTNIVDNNPEAVTYIQNLSAFLRYMLGSQNRDLVYLRDELKVLNHYFELQKSRFLDNLTVQMEIPEKYHLYTIPPLALQMLVENCIKHNIISSEKPLLITIYVKDEMIVIKNNLQRKTEVESTGQGLKNIIDRYRYFTTREINIHETDRDYSVAIPLLIVEI
jgi:hypothetical protein